MEAHAHNFTALAQTSLDPTRTTGLRARFVREMRARWVSHQRQIKRAIIDEDVFGIIPRDNVLRAASRDYEFLTAPQKVDAFMGWLEGKQSQGILQITRRPSAILAANSPWSDVFIQSAYQKGILRGRNELRKEAKRVGRNRTILAPESELNRTGIGGSFNRPFHAERVGLIYSRTYDNLKTVTAHTNTAIRRKLSDGLTSGLAQGLAEGKHPSMIARELVRDLNKSVNTIGKVRASMIARTETIAAHHKGNIGEMQLLAEELKRDGFETVVTVHAEMQIAETACEQCLDLSEDVNGATREYSIQEAESLIPVHPNCRCVVLPRIVRTKKAVAPPVARPVRRRSSLPSLRPPKTGLPRQGRPGQGQPLGTPAPPVASNLDRWVTDGWGVLSKDEKLLAVRRMLERVKHKKYGPGDAETVIRLPNVMSGLKTRYKKMLGTGPPPPLPPPVAVDRWIADGWAALNRDEKLLAVRRMLEKVKHSRYGPDDAEAVLGLPNVMSGLKTRYKKLIGAGPTVPKVPVVKAPAPTVPTPRAKVPKAKPGQPSTDAEYVARRRMPLAAAEELSYKEAEALRKRVLNVGGDELKELGEIHRAARSVYERDYQEYWALMKKYRDDYPTIDARHALPDVRVAYAKQASSSTEAYRAKDALNAARNGLTAKARGLLKTRDPVTIFANHTNFPKAQKKAMTSKTGEATEFYKSVLNRKSYGKDTVTDFGVQYERKQRAYYQSWTKSVHVSSSSKVSTYVHEIGHHLEYYGSEWYRRSKAFLRRRTAGESPVKLKEIYRNYGYDAHEITRADKFKDAYTGKVYNDATEVLSMGLESLYSNPLKFAKEDPDFFRFIVSLLKGWV